MNLRPQQPECCAIPSFATPRQHSYHITFKRKNQAFFLNFLKIHNYSARSERLLRRPHEKKKTIETDGQRVAEIGFEPTTPRV